MTPPGWLVSVSDWPFKAAEAAVHLSNWLRTLQLPQLTRDCSQMYNKIQFGLVLCKDVPTLRNTMTIVKHEARKHSLCNPRSKGGPCETLQIHITRMDLEKVGHKVFEGQKLKRKL